MGVNGVLEINRQYRDPKESLSAASAGPLYIEGFFLRSVCPPRLAASSILVQQSGSGLRAVCKDLCKIRLESALVPVESATPPAKESINSKSVARLGKTAT